MRANAPITATLALAVLSLSSAPLHAHPTLALRKARTQTPTTPSRHAPPKSASPHANSKTAHKSTPAKPKAKAKHRRHSQPVDDTDIPSVVRIRVPRTQATSSDFLHATNNPAPAASTALQPPTLPSIEQDAANPLILPSLYNKRGRLIVPKPLRGSHEILLHQNEVADRDGLDRVRDDEDILDLRGQSLLVPIPTGQTLLVDERLPSDRRYCRPWTAMFLSTVARAYYARFHTPLQVNSAVRTVEFQQHLIRTNGNAAPADGDTASPHLTGQAIDLAKHGLTLTQIAWLRSYLLPLVQQGKVDVEEEFKQACFHISVYRKYLPTVQFPKRNLAAAPHSEITSVD